MSEITPVAPEAAPSASSVENTAAQAVAPEAASPVEGAPEDQPEQSGETSEKPRQKASERIGELYGRMKSAERRAEQLAQEVERLRQPVVSQQQWDQLSFDEQQALQVRSAVRQERAEELAAEAYRGAREVERTRQEMFVSRVSEVKASIPDIETIVSDPTLPVSQIGARFITESEKGPHVAYWLSQNRTEAARIASLDPYSQAYELGKVESRISAAPQARKVSQAPAPVPKVGGGASAGAKDPSSMSMSEYVEWYRKRSA